MLSRTKGYLTVFLSLSIMIIMSLILALYQGARIGAVRMKTECVADISTNSVLAEYSRALYEQYGLFMVDTSYGTGRHTVINTEEHLRNYVQKNFDKSTAGRLRGASTMLGMYCRDAKITGTTFASDNRGAALKRQILAYMAAEPLEGLLSDVVSNTKMLRSAELDSTDVEEMARANQEQIDSIELPKVINEDGEEEEISLGNPADTVNSQKGIGIINLAITDPSKISGVVCDTSRYISHRQKNRGTGLRGYEDISVTERLLIEQYYYEKCSRYGAELEKSLLKYQLEYMIFGEGSDFNNLEKTAERLLFWREASNMLYLFGCKSKLDAADLIASLLTAVLLVPELKEPVKLSILFAWIFAESVSDLRILFNGGRVPLFKTDSTWKLSLENMFSFRDFLGADDGGSGLKYEDYLRVMLFMADSDKKTERFMDIVEMDIRRTDGNADFKLDYCLDTFCAEIEVATNYGYDVKIERIKGYE